MVSEWGGSRDHACAAPAQGWCWVSSPLTSSPLSMSLQSTAPGMLQWTRSSVSTSSAAAGGVALQGCSLQGRKRLGERAVHAKAPASSAMCLCDHVSHALAYGRMQCRGRTVASSRVPSAWHIGMPSMTGTGPLEISRSLFFFMEVGWRTSCAENGAAHSSRISSWAPSADSQSSLVTAVASAVHASVTCGGTSAEARRAIASFRCADVMIVAILARSSRAVLRARFRQARMWSLPQLVTRCHGLKGPAPHPGRLQALR